MKDDLEFKDDDFKVEFKEKTNLRPFEAGIKKYSEIGKL